MDGNEHRGSIESVNLEDIDKDLLNGSQILRKAAEDGNTKNCKGTMSIGLILLATL